MNCFTDLPRETMIGTTVALLVTLAFARVSTYPTSPIITGGIRNTNVNIPEVRNALNFAVGKLNEESVYMSEVVKVITATIQVCPQTSFSPRIRHNFLFCFVVRKVCFNEVPFVSGSICRMMICLFP